MRGTITPPKTPIRVPALTNGVLTYFALDQLRDRWTILCSLVSLDLTDVIFLDQQYEIFAESGASFVVLSRQDRPLHHSRVDCLRPLRIPILADPLGRLSRTYSTSTDQRLFRCQTSLLNPQLMLQSQISHDLDAHGIDKILELLAVIQ